MDSSFIAAAFALAAAAAWGSGDFSNGLAARRFGPFQTVLISYSVGLVGLLIVALVSAEPLPPPADLAWGALAGLSGALGIIFLLRGFAAGRMGIVAPVSAVLGTAIPVIFAALTEGLPRQLQLLGFGLALVAIWLLSRPEGADGRSSALGMAMLAGLGFGGFFTALGQVGPSARFWPLIAGRLASCILLVAFAIFRRGSTLPPLPILGLMALGGSLDLGGNLLFLLSIQSGRLDVAAVLGSFYPAATAILAWLIVKEHIAGVQMFGVVVAILAIVLITI
jgi:drug/metabolite transporter (DMT)-like permease